MLTQVGIFAVISPCSILNVSNLAMILHWLTALFDYLETSPSSISAIKMTDLPIYIFGIAAFHSVTSFSAKPTLHLLRLHFAVLRRTPALAGVV